MGIESQIGLAVVHCSVTKGLGRVAPLPLPPAACSSRPGKACVGTQKVGALAQDLGRIQVKLKPVVARIALLLQYLCVDEGYEWWLKTDGEEG